MQVEAAQNYILSRLEHELDPALFYHGIHHTRDVAETALIIANEENVTDTESLNLLTTAALFHDSGFLITYSGHEAAGCDIAQNILPEFGYTFAQIDTICGLIMSTKVPQNAATHLEKILCDADLDYLGRADFKNIGETLYLELKARSLISDRKGWNHLQVRFLESHYYHTNRSLALREPQKQLYLKELRNII